MITRIMGNPRAVAVVLGHLGASQDAMEHYATWYTDRQCSIVTGTSPPSRFSLNQSLKPTALEVWRETVKILRETPPNVPLVVHLFSNGGAFLLEEMEVLLESDGSGELSSGGLSRDDCDLIFQRLKNGYQLFDCCPCYIRMAWDWSHFSQSFPHPTWSAWARGSYTFVAATCLTIWCTATISWNRPSQFWARMLNSQVCLHNIYTYTTMDLATDAFKLEQLIDYRRTKFGADCRIYRFEDSNHCRLARDHPDEYTAVIDEALEAAIQRSTNPNS